MTKWSKTSTPKSSPALAISWVILTSSGEGVGSPEGWLWTTMIAAQLRLTASRKSSPTLSQAV